MERAGHTGPFFALFLEKKSFGNDSFFAFRTHLKVEAKTTASNEAKHLANTSYIIRATAAELRETIYKNPKNYRGAKICQTSH